jgi:hypothetical protein
MLRPRIVSRVSPGVDGSRPVGRSDRAMDVLQYGTAILAFVVALILAVQR